MCRFYETKWHFFEMFYQFYATKRLNCEKTYQLLDVLFTTYLVRFTTSLLSHFKLTETL